MQVVRSFLTLLPIVPPAYVLTLAVAATVQIARTNDYPMVEAAAAKFAERVLLDEKAYALLQSRRYQEFLRGLHSVAPRPRGGRDVAAEATAAAAAATAGNVAAVPPPPLAAVGAGRALTVQPAVAAAPSSPPPSRRRPAAVDRK